MVLLLETYATREDFAQYDKLQFAPRKNTN